MIQLSKITVAAASFLTLGIILGNDKGVKKLSPIYCEPKLQATTNIIPVLKTNRETVLQLFEKDKHKLLHVKK